jgi:hypothetical protein
MQRPQRSDYNYWFVTYTPQGAYLFDFDRQQAVYERDLRAWEKHEFYRKAGIVGALALVAFGLLRLLPLRR